MRVTFDIPDELAPALIPEGQDSARAALEAWGLEAYRQRNRSLRRIAGEFTSRATVKVRARSIR